MVRRASGKHVPGQPLEPAPAVGRVPLGDEPRCRSRRAGSASCSRRSPARTSVPLNVALPIYGPTIVAVLPLARRRAARRRGRQRLASGQPARSTPSPATCRRRPPARGGRTSSATPSSSCSRRWPILSAPLSAATRSLRLGQLDRLHHWPRNLADWFPWLPDGAVIAGEESALEGDHAAAIEQRLRGGRRGLPVFSAGLSPPRVPAPRVRGRARRRHSARTRKLVVEAGRLLERVLDVMPFTDFDRVSLAFRGNGRSATRARPRRPSPTSARRLAERRGV